jgi:hypothetical protein
MIPKSAAKYNSLLRSNSNSILKINIRILLTKIDLIKIQMELFI